MRKNFLCLLVSLFLWGCTYTGKHLTNEAPFTVAYPYIYSAPIVEKSPAPLAHYPLKAWQNKKTSALFFPFYYNPGKRNLALEKSLGHVFYQTWKGERVFNQSFFWQENIYSKQEALEIAQSKNTDFAVIGEITYLLDGGSLTNTALSLHLEIYSTTTLELLWSLDHAGRLDSSPDIDWYIVKRRVILPEDGLGYLLRNLALDLAKPVKIWALGEDYQKFILPKKGSTPVKKTTPLTNSTH